MSADEQYGKARKPETGPSTTLSTAEHNDRLA